MLVVSHGEFGTRWQKLAAAYGCDVVPLNYDWGEQPLAEDVSRALAESGARVALLVHSETSTGVVSDIRSLVQACNDAGVISVVDAISSLGAVPLETDDWGIDVVVTGSQKALMTPPGLAFAAISERAWARSAEATLPRYYWDWAGARKNQAKGSTPFTPATSIVVALNAALELILAEGLESIHARHVALGRACRAGAKAMGLELYSPDDDGAAVLTGILTPPDIDAIACGWPSVTGTGSRSQAVTVTSRIASSGSVTSATSTSSTSPRRSARSSCSSSRWARPSSEARPEPRWPPTNLQLDDARPRP